MHLDRNFGGEDRHRGKYGLILNRRIRELRLEGGGGVLAQVDQALNFLESIGVYDPANTQESECFVMRLKDVHSLPALEAYSRSVGDNDRFFASDIWTLSKRSGENNPFCKDPD